MITSETRDDEALRVAEEIVVVRARLAALVEKFRSIVGASNGHRDTTISPPIAVAYESAAARILSVFTRQPGKRISMQAVVSELADISPVLVRSTITRFARNKKLKKSGRGVYKSLPASTDAPEGKP